MFALSLVTYFLRSDYLLITNEKNDRFYLPLREKTFSLVYEHSTHHSDVYEDYKIERGKLHLYQTRFEDLGVGMPYDLIDGPFEFEDGKMLVKYDRTFESVTLRISPYAKHRICIQGEMINLNNFTQDEESLTIKYMKRIKFFTQDFPLSNH